jgi:exosortase A
MTDDSGTMKAPLTLPQTTSATSGLPRIAALMAVVFGVFALLWPTTGALVERWMDTISRAYTHGSMIIVIAAFLLWRRRALVAALEARPSWTAFAGTALLGCVWLVSYRSGIEVGHMILLPLICCGLVATVFGVAILRRLWLPLGYLFFAIPVWDLLNPSLQWASAFAVRVLLSLVGIPVYFDGLEFQIPTGRFEIAGGCSGLHFFIVGIAIAVLYGEVNNDSRKMRVKLLALAVLFALITNWLRIAIIILAGHHSQMQHHLVQQEHYTFGWGMFAVAMTIYFLIVRRWPAASPPAAECAPDASPAIPLKGVVLACLALALPAIAPLADANVAPTDRWAALRLPPAVPGWLRSESTGPRPPVFQNADRTEVHDFVRDGVTIQAFQAVYLEQMQGKEFAAFDNRPFGENVSPQEFSLAGDWLEARVRDRNGREWLARLLYRIDDAAFASARRAQLAYGVESLLGDPLSSVIVLRAGCASDCDGARNALDHFMRDATLTKGITP